jgi:LysR family nitrogen assimilation transcriptional regulator
VDVKALRYFLTVAECRSFSRASGLLHISQPAVSRMVRQLEAELGRPLFDRKSDGATLTEAGRVLFERGRAVLHQLEQAAADIRSGTAGLSGSIIAALPPGVGHTLAPRLLRRFAARHPKVAVRLVGGFSISIHEWLVRGQVDVALMHDPASRRDLDITPLLEEEVFIVGQHGAFPFEGDVSGARLAELPLILPSRPNTSRRLFDQWTASEGFWVEPVFEVDDHVITSGLIKAGLGLSTMTQGTIEADLLIEGVDARSLQPKAYWPLAVVSGKGTPTSEARRAFAATVVEVVGEMVAQGTWPGAISPRSPPSP